MQKQGPDDMKLDNATTAITHKYQWTGTIFKNGLKKTSWQTKMI